MRRGLGCAGLASPIISGGRRWPSTAPSSIDALAGCEAWRDCVLHGEREIGRRTVNRIDYLLGCMRQDGWRSSSVPEFRVHSGGH